MPDSQLLDRATELSRVVFTMDDDLLAIASQCIALRKAFAGVIYAHPLRITIGQAIRDLSTIAECLDSLDMAGKIEFLPL